MSNAGFVDKVKRNDRFDIPVQDTANVVVFREATDREAGVLKTIVDGLNNSPSEEETV